MARLSFFVERGKMQLCEVRRFVEAFYCRVGSVTRVWSGLTTPSGSPRGQDMDRQLSPIRYPKRSRSKG